MNKRILLSKRTLGLFFGLMVAAFTTSLKGIPVVAVADGFATGTTGGGTATPVLVVTPAELISAVAGSTPKVIHVGASLNLGGSVSLGSNTTIIGLSPDFLITGTLRVNNVTNVIIQNLTITNPRDPITNLYVGTGDGIEVRNSTMVFITQCTFIDCADGSIDIIQGSDFITVSWNRFRYPTQLTHMFANLIGNSDTLFTDRGRLRVTLHHNWYDHGTRERMPRVRFGQVHVFNNYFGSSNASYAIGVGNESQLLVENNFFENQPLPWRNMFQDDAERTRIPGIIQWSRNHFVNSPIPTWATNSTVFTPPYQYSLIAAADVKSVVMAGAGNVTRVASNLNDNWLPSRAVNPVVYPNPVTGGVLNVYLDGLAGVSIITLADLTGRVVWRGTVNNEPRIEIPVDGKPAIYILTITNGQQVFNQKVVVVR